MDTDVKDITAATVPRRSPHSQRRKYGGDCWLAQRNNHYNIDDAFDAVWAECDGIATTGEIASRLSSSRGWAPERALAIAMLAVRAFSDARLIETDDRSMGRTDRAPADSRRSSRGCNRDESEA